MMVYGGDFTPTSIVRMWTDAEADHVHFSDAATGLDHAERSIKTEVWIISVIDWGQGGAVSNGVSFTVR